MSGFRNKSRCGATSILGSTPSGTKAVGPCGHLTQRDSQSSSRIFSRPWNFANIRIIRRHMRHHGTDLKVDRPSDIRLEVGSRGQLLTFSFADIARHDGWPSEAAFLKAVSGSQPVRISGLVSTVSHRTAVCARRDFQSPCPRDSQPADAFPELHKEGHMKTGHRLFCKEFLCFNTMPCRHVPFLVHFWR